MSERDASFGPYCGGRRFAARDDASQARDASRRGTTLRGRGTLRDAGRFAGAGIGRPERLRVLRCKYGLPMGFRTHTPTLVLSLCLAACSALGGGDTGLRDELAASRAETQAERERVEALEQRLTQLEHNSQVQVRDRRVEARLERLIEQNETILARSQSALCPAPATQPAAQSSMTPPTGSASFEDASDDEQRRQLEERLRAFSRGPSGGLSLQQREAMRVLLRKDRVLDRSDPWH